MFAVLLLGLLQWLTTADAVRVCVSAAAAAPVALFSARQVVLLPELLLLDHYSHPCCILCCAV
jgi:hypothetical protein